MPDLSGKHYEKKFFGLAKDKELKVKVRTQNFTPLRPKKIREDEITGASYIA